VALPAAALSKILQAITKSPLGTQESASYSYSFLSSFFFPFFFIHVRYMSHRKIPYPNLVFVEALDAFIQEAKAQNNDHEVTVFQNYKRLLASYPEKIEDAMATHSIVGHTTAERIKKYFDDYEKKMGRGSGETPLKILKSPN